MMLTPARLTAIWLALVGAGVSGQQLVTLASGQACEGHLTHRGSSTIIKSPVGTRRVKRSDVKDVGPLDPIVRAYQGQQQGLPEGFTDGRVALARWALERGYITGAMEQLETVLRADVDHPEARKMIQSLAEVWSVDASEGADRGRDQRRFADVLFEKLAPRGLFWAALAGEKTSLIPSELTWQPAMKALKHLKPQVRWLGARTLAQHRQKRERINPLYRASLTDPAFAVRRESVRSLKVTEDPVFARLYAKNILKSQDRFVRRNAGEALGELGMKQGIEPLVAGLAQGGTSRAHITDTVHRAYVKDFDVEIAQAAVIADPIVDTVTEGTVFDVGVVSVVEELRTYAGALNRLTGMNFGTDVRAWKTWLEGSN